ncbi:MAG: hypothetical protein AAF437_07145 [Pseudomonadota bacterium]
MPDRSIFSAAWLLSGIVLAACGGANAPDPMPVDVEAAAQVDSGALLASACSGCHSDQAGAIASLANYAPDQIQSAFQRYKDESDGTTVMHRLARGYSDEDIALVSAYLNQTKHTP